MKIKRSRKDYGSGFGNISFESDLFSVTEWNLHEGIQTTIACKLIDSYELRFAGKQEFTSDKLCIEQLNPNEIIRIIKAQKERGFEAGKQYKINEFKRLLEL